MASADQPLAGSPTVTGRVGLGRRAALLAALTLVGLGLRLFRLDFNGYWHDEIISTFLARLPPAEIYSAVTVSDSHPPLYHLLLHAWGLIVGYELVPLRLLSVVIGALCVPATYLLGRAVASPAVGLLAAALMAVAPFQIFHGQQARMYPLLSLLVLLALLTFLGAWRRGGLWRWALFGLVAAAGLYTHIYFSFSLLALNLWALRQSALLRRIDRARWAGLLLAQAAAVALFGPFLLSLFQLTSSVVASFWIPRVTILDWLFALVAVTNGGEAGGAVSASYLLLSYLPAVAAFLLATVAVIRAADRGAEQRAAAELLLFAVLTPCLVATLLSLTVRPILLSRSLIGIGGPLYVLLAWAAVRAWARPLTRAVALALGLSVAVGLGAVYPAQPRVHSLEAAVATIFAERAPGDAIILLDWQSFDLVALRRPDATDVYVGAPAEGVASWQRRMALMRWHTPDQVGPPTGYAGRYGRVWVLATPYTYPSAWEAVAPWLSAHGHPVQEHELGDGRVLLYELSL